MAVMESMTKRAEGLPLPVGRAHCRCYSRHQQLCVLLGRQPSQAGSLPLLPLPLLPCRMLSRTPWQSPASQASQGLSEL